MPLTDRKSFILVVGPDLLFKVKARALVLRIMLQLIKFKLMMFHSSGSRVSSLSFSFFTLSPAARTHRAGEIWPFFVVVVFRFLI